MNKMENALSERNEKKVKSLEVKKNLEKCQMLI